MPSPRRGTLRRGVPADSTAAGMKRRNWERASTFSSHGHAPTFRPVKPTRQFARASTCRAPVHVSMFLRFPCQRSYGNVPCIGSEVSRGSGRMCSTALGGYRRCDVGQGRWGGGAGQAPVTVRVGGGGELGTPSRPLRRSADCVQLYPASRGAIVARTSRWQVGTWHASGRAPDATATSPDIKLAPRARSLKTSTEHHLGTELSAVKARP